MPVASYGEQRLNELSVIRGTPLRYDGDRLRSDTRIHGVCVEPGCECETSRAFVKVWNKPTCFLCNTHKKQHQQATLRRNNLDTYGYENVSQIPEVQAKVRQTNQSRLGVDYPVQSPEVMAKARQTNLDKLGVEHALQSEEMMAKFRATNLTRRGVEYPMQSREVMAKSRQTNLDKLGVEYAMQDPVICERGQKTRFKFKDYTFEDGTVQNVQGYEPYALQRLERMGEVASDILTGKGEVPAVWYETKGKRHRYFVDIFVPKEKLLIEVKSTYTLKNDFEKIRATREQSEALGYEFKLWVFDAKGHLVAENCDQCNLVVWKPLTLPASAFAAPGDLEDPWKTFRVNRPQPLLLK